MLVFQTIYNLVFGKCKCRRRQLRDSFLAVSYKFERKAAFKSITVTRRIGSATFQILNRSEDRVSFFPFGYLHKNTIMLIFLVLKVLQ